MRPRRLSPGFFRKPTLRAARDLLGMLLVHSGGSRGTVAGMIVETEAYTGAADPGSHASRGLTRRNAPMFGPPGRAYVYKCHLYPLLNVVTEQAGRPGAVLLRALEPVAGEKSMARRRNNPSERADLANGPGKLCQAMGVGMAHNRANLLRGPLFLARPARRPGFRVARSRRIGLRGPARRLPWRFFVSGNRFVSPGRPG